MPSPSELRVMSYNVRSLRDDSHAVGAVIRRCEPDVLLVQEAPRFLRWRSKRAAMAREAGLVVATANRPGGLCVMTSLRMEVKATTFTLLPKTPRRHQRALAGATLTCGGLTWQVVTTHLSTDSTERRRHLPAVRSALASHPDAPLVLGGDLNDDPTGDAFTDLAEELQDCFAVAGEGTGATSPANAPRRRIDAILVDPALTVVSCEVVSVPGVENASDHRPVLAVLRQS